MMALIAALVVDEEVQAVEDIPKTALAKRPSMTEETSPVAMVIADDRLTSTIFLSVNIQPQLASFQQIPQQSKIPEHCGELLGGTGYPNTRTCQNASMQYTCF